MPPIQSACLFDHGVYVGQFHSLEHWPGASFTPVTVLLDLVGVDVVVIGMFFFVFVVQIGDFLLIFGIEISPHFLLNVLLFLRFHLFVDELSLLYTL